MSNNFVMDFTADVGKVENEATWVKLKMGRGAQDCAALKQEVESGSGVKLDDLFVSLWFPDGADTDALKDIVQSMIPGPEDSVQVLTGKNGGVWVMLSVAQAVGDGGEKAMFDDVQAQVDSFFGQVESNAYLEFALRSDETFTKAVETAKANNEANLGDDTPSSDGSLMAFMNSFSTNFRCDIDHEFIISVLKFATKLGVPLTPEFFEFVKKFNLFAAKLSLNRADGVEANTANCMRNYFFRAMRDMKDMFAELTAFKTLCNQMRLIFLLKDDTYLNLDVNTPGFQSYVEYFETA